MKQSYGTRSNTTGHDNFSIFKFIQKLLKLTIVEIEFTISPPIYKSFLNWYSKMKNSLTVEKIYPNYFISNRILQTIHSLLDVGCGDLKKWPGCCPEWCQQELRESDNYLHEPKTKRMVLAVESLGFAWLDVYLQRRRSWLAIMISDQTLEFF